jgi:predicted HicB family RNase H-like nuclease
MAGKSTDGADSVSRSFGKLAQLTAEERESMQAPQRRVGGKATRTDTVGVRLDPKLNYLCELAARAQRRSKSSFIEWAIEHALADVGIPGTRKNAQEPWSINDKQADLWDVDESDRLIALAGRRPHC